jgi:hypothetical protein
MARACPEERLIVTNRKKQRARAEKRKQDQSTEASRAMADYHAAARATREKTARLCKLREAKEIAHKQPAKQGKDKCA